MFNSFYPGESAHLLCLWNGLDVSAHAPYPLMGLLAKPFGLTNLLAPVLGVLAALGIYLFVSRAVRLFTASEDVSRDAAFAGRLAGGAAVLAFVLSPATLSAASHVEPALFGVVATLAAALVLMRGLAARGTALSCALVSAAGFLFGFFADECPLAAASAALAAVAILWNYIRRMRVGRAFAVLALFSFTFAAGFLVYTLALAEDLVTALIAAKRGLLGAVTLSDGGGARAVFALLPFLASAVLLTGAYGDRSSRRRATLGHLAILILVAFGLFADFSATSVASAALLAMAFGEALAYFAVTARADYRARPAAGTRFRNVRFVARSLAAAVLAVFAVFAFARAAVTFDGSYAFADRIATRILDALGPRTWLVTDGRLDDHLRLVAARRGQEVTFVNVSRDFDAAAKKEMSAVITRRLGARAPELVRSLDIGFLPFLEDWLKGDPAAAKSVAVVAAPDLLFACGLTPVPEVYFFGTDGKAKADWSVWHELARILEAPEGWGSANLYGEKGLSTRFRHDLRRYLGLVANNRGVWLQDHGDLEGACRLYSLVLDEIDTDNVSAIFNLLALADDGFKPAAARLNELKLKLKAIVADETRRYRLWALANYYGTIRNVPALLQLGYAWAKSGRPGEALMQIRRAADLVPSERRESLMNMIAALLADADQRRESRQIYERRLTERPEDHAALLGLVRLELLDGDEAKARAYLERAVAAGGDDPRVRTEMALLAMMKGDSAQARDILKSVTASNPKDVKAWSLLSAATIQVSDQTKDPVARAALDNELEKVILPSMQANARGEENYYVHSTRAFLAMRKGAAGRKAARAALLAAMQARPDVPVTREMLLEMDVSLDDAAAAEQHARQTLRIDRSSPMANYVMGSLALGKDDLAAAEMYLRRAVQAKNPGAFALNDYAETLRLLGRPEEAEPYARRVVKVSPDLYAGWDTLAAIILDRKGNADEALEAVTKAVELSTKDGRAQDVSTLVTLARVQAEKGDRKLFNMTMRKIEGRVGELKGRSRAAYEALLKK